RIRNAGCALCKLPFEQRESQTLIAFACGHVFHLRCLLKKQKWIKKHSGQPDITDSALSEINVDLVENDDDEEEEGEDEIERVIFAADKAMADAAETET